MEKRFVFLFFCTSTYIVASRGKVVKTRVFNSLNFFLASSYNSVTLVVDRFICNTVLVLRRDTPPNSEILCGQNVGTKVVCGMILFFEKKAMLKI